MDYRKYFAEWIGTFALVFCGTGAIVVNQEFNGVITHLGIALTFGMIVAAMIFALGDVSGAHLNPAVTLAFAIAGRFPANQIIPFVVSQAAGAFSASFTLAGLFPDNELLGTTLPSGSALQSFIFEGILTFILVMVIFNVTTGAKEKGITAAIAIGSVVALEALFAGPVCGASMNPIRSLAPALVSGNTQFFWIYLIAPTAGALLAVFTHQFLYPKKYVQHH